MISLEQASPSGIEAQAEALGFALPIEQTQVWADYQATIDGRTPWGGYVIKDGGTTLGFVSFVDYETHGYHFLRSVHGPAWIHKPDKANEREAVNALRAAVRRRDRRQVFLRFAVWHYEEDWALPTLSTVPYNETVVIDVTGGDEEILARMKTRGRRDVRKSLRECPAVCTDETREAIADFSEYYAVMEETGARDGFAPAPMSDYADMIRMLGANHCRVFAARNEGRLVAWSIVTVNGTHAVRYYAAMRDDARRMHVTDRLLYWECCELGRQGIADYDLMGIGNDFNPSIKGLNEFKTKFTKQTTPVAPDRDITVRKGFYTALTLVKRLRGALRH
ncbi:GNAT family N-acetyltransferase [Bifidobacterium pullorum subsp. saeculare]|uniref:GNAT family N-acetyltransferase n=1 Tax=Bifidobacterium pullorum subsp. saeculare TaxID=78257 RepID=A0A939B7L7_9BIFI|nr:GNAT family N-acetyltransferase [Bifidobacterium pullorum]MBM6698972.1 GNAT family N-acetyltransferase [Bifidobacterium pullorum subsp. saeculare]